MKSFTSSRVQRVRDQLNMLLSTGQLRVDLPIILSSIRASSPIEERVAAFEQLMTWIRLPLNEDVNSLSSRSVRFRFVLQLLERNPEWKAQFVATLRSFMAEASAVRLFCQTGLNQEAGFFSEAADRLSRRWLPRFEAETDLAELFDRIFDFEEDAEWIETSPESVIQPILDLLGSDPANSLALAPLQKAINDALVVLGAQVAAIGVAEDIRVRLQSQDISESPFIDLNRTLNRPLLASEMDGLFAQLDRCRSALAYIVQKTEEAGVSIALVYKLEKLGSCLRRIEFLFLLKIFSEPSDRLRVLPVFIGSLIRDEIKTQSMRSLVRGNLHLLARKIVERSGNSGEHYISRSRHEIFQMLLSAAGGGLLTVFTILAKLWIGKAKMALFFEGLFSWVNYAGSFVAMQLAGFTLATKQPSMTASALAGKLEQLQKNNIDAATEEIALITRSQIVAAAGNLGAVIPGAIALEIFFRQYLGRSVIPPDYAQAFIHSLNPLTSLTIPLAALTGVFLWMASIASGWSENWVVYRQVPQWISRSRRLNRVFGAERVESWAKKAAPTFAGLTGNVSLGFFLAFTPIFGRFFGLPLDVRHVTLSTGALTLAVCSIGKFGPGGVSWVSLSAAIVGIVIIGALNFGVSFMLALEVAARAREIKRTWLIRILRKVGRRLLREPRAFLIGQSSSASAQIAD